MTNHDLDLPFPIIDRIFSSGCSRAAPSGLTQIPQVECYSSNVQRSVLRVFCQHYTARDTCAARRVVSQRYQLKQTRPRTRTITIFARPISPTPVFVALMGLRSLHGMSTKQLPSSNGNVRPILPQPEVRFHHDLYTRTRTYGVAYSDAPERTSHTTRTCHPHRCTGRLGLCHCCASAGAVHGDCSLEAVGIGRTGTRWGMQT